MFVHSVECRCVEHTQVNSLQKARLLWIALGLIGGFSAIELAVSVSSGSLALLAEAGHMVSDCTALAIALLATWIARWPKSEQAPFGYRRVEIVAALVNGLGLVAIALWIAWEAVERLQAPATEIVALPMLMTAVLGLVVNGINISLLHGHSHTDLNLKGAFLHMVADAIGSVGVIVAAIAVYAFGWYWADSVISLMVAAVIVAGAVPLIHQSFGILLEQTPGYLDANAVKARLESFDGILRVENFRLWAIAPGQEMLLAHCVVDVADGAVRDRLLRDAQSVLMDEFGLADVCLQMSAPVLSRVVNLSQHHVLELLAAQSTQLND
ncbi:cation diffusion facilitator family transporter [Leptolyngbya sp. AN02str]|uniref:cation diffusion facilitator family transporter n=1 Tax=Leptolyngbya sp. AN02str TaxID=3423363 RepID=UPI003D31412C